MPAAVPAIVVGGIGVAADFITVEMFALSVLTAAASAVISNAMAGDSQLTNAFADGQRLNVSSNVEPIPLVYGSVDHLSGAVVWRASHSACPTRGPDNTDCLTTVIVWSEGEISAVNRLYFNDIASDDERFVHGTVFGGCIRSTDNTRVWLTHHVGTDDQAADAIAVIIADENEALAGKWSTDHRLRGVAYSRATLRFEDGLYGPNAIPVITAAVDGKLCYDFRTGLTGFTSNPAVVLYDYLTNDRYGCAFAASEIDLPSFIEAANYCDVYVVPLGTEGARRRYTCNGVLSATDSRLDNVKKILSTCRGFLINAGGLYKLRIDKPEVAAFDFNEDNIVGGWSIQLDSYGRRFNRVTAKFINPAKEWQPDMVVVDSPDYRINDRGEVLETDIELSLVTSRAQAQDIAELTLRQSRYAAVVELTATLEALRCEVGDVVTVSHEVPGWSGKLFRVERLDLLNTDEVRVTLGEYNDDAYNIDAEPQDEIPVGTTLPDPRQLQAVADLALTRGRDVADGGRVLRFIDATWTPTEQSGVVGYDLEWGPTSAGAGGVGWQFLSLRRPEVGNIRLPGLLAGIEYTVRIRARNSIGTASAWASVAITTLQAGAPRPLVEVTLVQTAAGIGTIAWTPPDDDRVTEVEIWTATGRDFFSTGISSPVLLATVPVVPSVYEVSSVGTDRAFWLRAKSFGYGLSDHYTPSEYSGGVYITG